MVEFITVVYFIYMFISLYFLFLFTLTFLQNKKEIFEIPEIKKNFSLSVLIPAYNEEDSIRGTVESVLNSDYKDIIEIIIINDGSNDKTLKIAKELEKRYRKVRVLDKKNSGKADSLNQAIKIAKGELIAVVDADSYPEKHSISSMVGFFHEKNVGAVTTRVLVKNKDSFIRVLQGVEYKLIAFTRKLLGFLDAIYVTPGPLALYKKSALEHIDGFDTKNMTEDIEATWHLVSEGYKIRMSFASRVFTVAPNTFKKWFKQRIRWNIGGIQTILKYKHLFFRKGMLGRFILPFFSISLLLGIFGIGIFSYRIFRRFAVSYLSTKGSIASETAILTLQDINLNPSVLNFFGVVLFVLGLLFLFFALKMVNMKTNEKERFFSVIFYSIIYITAYPFILIASLYKFMRGKYSWR
ncbi:MAG: glycosyltransferase [Nanoarchaeota archaeon]